MEIVTTILGILNQWVRDIKKWRERPKPRIFFEQSIFPDQNIHCHIRPTVSPPFNGINCWFLRLGVINEGKEKIESADIRVEKIEKINENNSRTIINDSPFYLHWANDNTDDSKVLYCKRAEYIDVVHSAENYPYFFVFYKNKHAVAGIVNRLGSGSYSLSLTLVGSGIAPMEKELIVEFRGDWKSLNMKIIK